MPSVQAPPTPSVWIISACAPTARSTLDNAKSESSRAPRRPRSAASRGRATSPPASVDEAVDLVHVEAVHFRQPPLAPEYAGAVLLPVDDVGERVFHRPRVPRRRPRDTPFPVRRA